MARWQVLTDTCHADPSLTVVTADGSECTAAELAAAAGQQALAASLKVRADADNSIVPLIQSKRSAYLNHI